MTFKKPVIIDRTSKALGAGTTGHYPKRSLSQVKRSVWHYTAVDRTYGRFISDHEAFWARQYGWDLGGYHFYIATDAKIYQNYPLTTVSYGAGYLNPECIHICVEGNSAKGYTEAQKKARWELTCYLHEQLNLPGNRLFGHFEVPGNSTACPGYTVAEMNKFRSDLTAALAGSKVSPKSKRFVDLPDYKAPAKAFDKLKVGDKVTIREGMKAWYNPEDGEGIAPSIDVVGVKDTIIEVREVKSGYSTRAYLLKDKLSWILEQDLVEARKSWTPVAKPENTGKMPGSIKLPDPNGRYVYIEGAYYKF